MSELPVYEGLSAEEVRGRYNVIDPEVIIDVEHYPVSLPAKHISTLRALAKLTGVEQSRDIGTNGPSNASNTREDSSGEGHQGLYDVFFVRDAHVVTRFVEKRYPTLTKATILETLKFTGVRNNLRSLALKDDQEQGKAPHEIRDGNTDPIAIELSEKKDWGWPYYGAVDSTVKNAGAITRVALREFEEGMTDMPFLSETYEGLDGKEHSVEDGLAAHLNWMRQRMNLNPEGLIESLSMNPKHHANQTWVDSPDAFHHKDGSWARHHPDKNWGVASVELQAEAYDTLLGAADVYESQLQTAVGNRKSYLESEVTDLRARAAKLKDAVLTHFWVEDETGGYLARGTDRDEDGTLHPLEIRTSDMGQVLETRLLDDEPERVEAIVEQLFSPEMLGKWGVRTLSTDSVRYFEDGYHKGDVWGWVNYSIALGLDRHGYHGLSKDLKDRIIAQYAESRILPEFVPGGEELLITNRVLVDDPSLTTETIHPVSQPAQELQAWTAAAVLAIKLENGLRILPGANKDKVVPIRAMDPRKQQLEDRVLSTAA